MNNYFTLKKTIKDFTAEKNSLHYVHIFLWAKGICIVGHNTNNEVINAVSYSFQEVYPLKSFEQLILNEPLLADPYLIRKVWYAVSRNMIVPKALSDKEKVDKWFQEIYYLEKDEMMTHSSASGWQAEIYYPKKIALREILHQYFPSRKSQFLIAPSNFLHFNTTESKYQIIVFWLEHSCNITIIENQKLRHHFIIETANPKEIIIRVNEIIQDEDDLMNAQFFITGINSELAEWLDELKSYGLHVNENESFNLLSALKLLAECE